MRDYVLEMSAMPSIGVPPDYCWVIDMMHIVDGDLNTSTIDIPPEAVADLEFLSLTLQGSNMTFDEKLDLVLNIPQLQSVYGDNIVRNDNMEITASRCYLYTRDFDLDDVQAQVNLLFDQRSISESQPINQQPEHRDNWAFFTYSNLFSYW